MPIAWNLMMLRFDAEIAFEMNSLFGHKLWLTSAFVRTDVFLLSSLKTLQNRCFWILIKKDFLL